MTNWELHRIGVGGRRLLLSLSNVAPRKMTDAQPEPPHTRPTNDPRSNFPVSHAAAAQLGYCSRLLFLNRAIAVMRVAALNLHGHVRNSQIFAIVELCDEWKELRANRKRIAGQVKRILTILSQGKSEEARWISRGIEAADAALRQLQVTLAKRGLKQVPGKTEDQDSFGLLPISPQAATGNGLSATPSDTMRHLTPALPEPTFDVVAWKEERRARKPRKNDVLFEMLGEGPSTDERFPSGATSRGTAADCPFAPEHCSQPMSKRQAALLYWESDLKLAGKSLSQALTNELVNRGARFHELNRELFIFDTTHFRPEIAAAFARGPVRRDRKRRKQS